MPPLVSILLPVRDARPWLPEALESIRRQTLEDWELVAVDDGSRDGSGTLLVEAAREDPRLRRLSTSPRARGLVAALNLGLDACRGRFVARMDADDVMTSERLAFQVAALERDETLSGVSCRVRLFPRERLREGSRRYEDWLNSLLGPEEIARERFVESPLPHPSVLVRTGVLQEAGYRDLGGPEDYDLWLRLLGAGHRFSKVDRSLLRWRDHPRRASRRDARYARERFVECKARHLREGPLADGRPVGIWGAGPTGKRMGRLLSRDGPETRFFVDVDRRKIGQRIHHAPVVSPERLEETWTDRETVLLVAVSRWDARQWIREHLHGIDRREGVDFWCIA